MHSDPQISLHAIAVPFRSSCDAKIQRLCRVKIGGGAVSIVLDSTRLCTDQFIRAELSDKATTNACWARLVAPVRRSSSRAGYIGGEEKLEH